MDNLGDFSCNRFRDPWPRVGSVMSLTESIALICVLLSAVGCGDKVAGPRSELSNPSNGNGVLRIAVTTSTRDSGLLDVLIPPFEALHNVRVDVIAVGSGAALQQGRDGNVDVVWVHSPADEEEFMARGHGLRREAVMGNHFLLLGPPDDPAGIAGLPPAQALGMIAARGERFVSRGDRSGTHARELSLWTSLGGRPRWDGYVESGQGMGATLTMCNQMRGYTLTDRGTFLARARGLELVPLVGPSPSLYNPYHVIAIDPSKHPSIQGSLADTFVDYLVSPGAQGLIANFRVDGETLFEPAHPPR